MAAHERSLALSERYRQLAAQLADQAAHTARGQWSLVDLADIDRSHPQWLRAVMPTLVALQAAGVRLTAAYLTAFLQSELGQPVPGPAITEGNYVGRSRTGKPLEETLASTSITIKQAIAVGVTPATAGQEGLHRAARLAAAETIASARSALSDVIKTDHRISGWKRVTHAGCGACVAAASGSFDRDYPFPVHDGCKCTAEPVVRDVPDRFPRATGSDLFNQMTIEQQNELLGDQKAGLIRSGQVPLADLIATSPMAAIPDQITEAPLSALQAQAA